MNKNKEIILIKKYPNRRLYDTSTSSYVTLQDIAKFVKDDINFVVLDSKTSEDITRQTLAQIIIEMELNGANLLPLNFLKQIICFYDENLSNSFNQYIEQFTQNFATIIDKVSTTSNKPKDVFSSMKMAEEIGKQNMKIIEETFNIFNPFKYKNPKDKE
jgi:polyhydroxyalkanoate synthesis repressor PhaR